MQGHKKRVRAGLNVITHCDNINCDKNANYQ